jgi:hypothetical protein
MAYRNVAGVGRVKTKGHVEWKRGAGIIAKLQYRQQGSPVIAPKTPFKVLLLVNINRRGDIMNREKLLTDLFVGLGIVPDDCWCDEYIVRRAQDIDGCEVFIEVLGPEQVGNSGPVTGSDNIG